MLKNISSYGNWRVYIFSLNNHKIYTIIIGMRSAERRKVDFSEMKCLRSLVRVSRTDKVRNEEVRRRAGIEKELRVGRIREY